MPLLSVVAVAGDILSRVFDPGVSRKCGHKKKRVLSMLSFGDQGSFPRRLTCCLTEILADGGVGVRQGAGVLCFLSLPRVW